MNRRNMLYALLLAVAFPTMLKVYGASLRANILFVMLLAMFTLFAYGRESRFQYDKDFRVLSLGTARSGEGAAYDCIRVLACVLVIVTHIVNMDVDAGVFTGESTNYVMRIVYILALICNPLFIMLSGCLLLEAKEESLKDFYLKRVTKIAVPMIAYYFLCMVLCGYEFDGKNVGNALLGLVTGDTPLAPQYWLMYTLLELYVLVPFLRVMLKEMPYKYLTYIVWIFYIFSALIYFIPVKVKIVPEFASFLGVFIIGHWLKKEETRKYFRLIQILGIVSLVAMCIIIKFSEYHLAIVANASPIMVTIAMAVYTLVLKAYKGKEKKHPVLGFISKYSFGIILVHAVVMVYLQNTLKINCGQWFIIGGTLRYGLLVFVVSLIWAYLFDNTAIFIINLIMRGKKHDNN